MSLIESLSRPRTLAVLLAVSLGANVFLAGAIAGRLGAWHAHGGPPGAPAADTLIQFVPEQGRRAMRAQLHEQRPELLEEHKEMSRLHRRIGEELQRAQPDRKALADLHAELRALQGKIEEALQGAFLDAVLAMPQAERQAMVERMRHHRGALLRGPGPHPFTMPPPPPGAMPPPGDGPPMPGMDTEPFEAPLPPAEEPETDNPD